MIDDHRPALLPHRERDYRPGIGAAFEIASRALSGMAPGPFGDSVAVGFCII